MAEMVENKLYNDEIEKYLIKCMCNSNTTRTNIIDKLRSEDFHNSYYRNIFKAIKKLSIKGEEVTPEQIMEYFRIEDMYIFESFKKIGGTVKLENIFFSDGKLPEKINLDSQIKEMKSYSYRRKVMETAKMMEYFAEFNEDMESKESFTNVEEMDERIKEQVYKLANTFSSVKEIKEIGSAVDLLKEEILNGGTVGIDISRIGYAKLNRVIKRLRDGALYVIGAPEKVGKSSIMLDISWRIASELEIPVAYGDTEMTTQETLLRIVSKMSGIEEDKIADNNLSEHEMKIVNANFEKIRKVPFFHFNTNEMTNAELESKVKTLQLKHGIRLFVYDYVKIQSHESNAGRPDLILASKIDTLKEKICKQCNIPVITSGQMYKKHQNDSRGDYNKFCETSHFTKLADVILRLDRITDDDPEMVGMGTHYIEVVTGRKIKNTDIGKKITYDFIMENHQIKENNIVNPI